MYKQAVILNLRFTAPAGLLTVEQLYKIDMRVLDNMTVEAGEAYKNSRNKSFLVKTTAKDKMLKLKFNILLDVLTTRVEEQDELANAGEIKRHNNHIDELIAKKKDEELANMSIENLEKMKK